MPKRNNRRKPTTRSRPQRKSPPSEDRVLHALQNLEPTSPLIGVGFERLHQIMALIEWGLIHASQTEPQSLFSNEVAGLSGLIRAYQGLQAAAVLAVTGFYTEARASIRGIYESAGVARMLAHSQDLSERWMRENEWVPDRKSRQFAAMMAGGDDEAKIPHQQYYKRASASAHPSALSTLPYLFDQNGRISPTLYPRFNDGSFVAVANELTAQALFVAFCIRNAVADADFIPPDWLQELAGHAREFSGEPLEHLEADWGEREQRFQELGMNVRAIEEIDDFLLAHPNSAYNIKQRANDVRPDSD